MEVREIKKDRAKVALVLDSWFPFDGGQQCYVAKLAEHLVKEEGLDVDIYTRAIRGKLSAEEKAFEKIEGIRVIRMGLPTGPRNYFMRLWFLIAATSRLTWRGKKYQLVHAHSTLGAIAMKAASWFTQTPSLLTVHGNQVFSKRWTLKKVLHRIMFLETKYTQEMSISENLLKATNVNDHVLVIPGGIDLEPFDRLKDHQVSESYEVLYEGPLEWDKGLDVLLQAAKQVIDSSAFIQTKLDFHLHIVGQGSMQRSLKNMAEKLGIAHYIKFHSKLSEEKCLELYKSADLFVMPSRSDALPHALLRACAAKLPILATDVGDHRKLVLENQNGHLVHPDDIKEMAYYLEYYSLNPQLKQMGEVGYEIVKEEFDWETCMKKNARVYERIGVTPQKRVFMPWQVPRLMVQRRQFDSEYKGKETLNFCLTVNVEQIPGGKELASEEAHIPPFLDRFFEFCETLEIPSTLFFQSDLLEHHSESIEAFKKAKHELGVKIPDQNWESIPGRRKNIRKLRSDLDETGYKNIRMFRSPIEPTEDELKYLHEHGFEFLPVSEDPMPHIRFKYGVVPVGHIFSMDLEHFSNLSDDELLASVNRLRAHQKKNGVPSFVIFSASSWEFQALPGKKYTGGENFTNLSKKLSFLSKHMTIEFQTLSDFCKSCINSAHTDKKS